jgi:hypothetical protein
MFGEPQRAAQRNEPVRRAETEATVREAAAALVDMELAKAAA